MNGVLPNPKTARPSWCRSSIRPKCGPSSSSSKGSSQHVPAGPPTTTWQEISRLVEVSVSGALFVGPRIGVVPARACRPQVCKRVFRLVPGLVGATHDRVAGRQTDDLGAAPDHRGASARPRSPATSPQRTAPSRSYPSTLARILDSTNRGEQRMSRARRMRRATITAGAVGAAVIAVGATAAARPVAHQSSRVTVFAAASLTKVFPQIDGGPKYSFAGSDMLATQITQGAPADVFAAASPKQPDALFEQGLVLKPVVFATNRLVLIVPKGNPAHIHKVSDITKKGVKLVIGDATVPIGAYTRTVLGKLHLTAALRNVKSNETDVKAGRREGSSRRGRRRLRLRDRRAHGWPFRALDHSPGQGSADGEVRDRRRQSQLQPRGGQGVRGQGSVR